MDRQVLEADVRRLEQKAIFRWSLAKACVNVLSVQEQVSAAQAWVVAAGAKASAAEARAEAAEAELHSLRQQVSESFTSSSPYVPPSPWAHDADGFRAPKASRAA